ncbi:hypothetical protein CSW65_06110 [Streptococcus agalactiae]|nr:hypothetical protein CSW65_06110 [Streptococcus agalactiae]RRA61243.1 hypothetical protein D5F95_03760 [Streptococcus agalactiae]RRB00323.1 hypothetical protein D5F93_08250 [Streptococcus agalactiae]
MANFQGKRWYVYNHQEKNLLCLICKIKLDRKKPFMLGSDKHHICLKGTNINDLYPSYHK